MSSTQCKGKKNLDTQCKNFAIEGEEYCGIHLYFKTYTEAMMKNLKKCCRCANMFYYESLNQCPPCTNRSRQQSKVISKERKKIIKCEGITRKGTKCTYNQLPNSKYCCDHQYMNNYADYMLKNLRQCSDCSSYKYFDIDYSTCDECREYRSNKRDENKLRQDGIPKCKVINCTRNSKFGEYCGKHKILQLREDAEKDGFKLCGNGNHNCMNRIPLESKHIYCDECFQKHRDEDKERYEKEKQSVEEFNSEHDDMMKCIKCGKEFSIDDCVKDIHGNISKKCRDCFKKQQDIESKRHERHRDWAKEYQHFLIQPDQVAKQLKWNQENHARIIQYSRDYRKRQEEKYGSEEYHQILADYAREYRHDNPEITKKMYENAKKNLKRNYYNYTYSATSRNISWDKEFTYDMCCKMFKSQCYYCGKKYITNGHLLGIDRVDNTLGYTETNCVPCCGICNYMKRAHSKNNIFKYM